MVTARLTGNIWATRKSDLLSGYKLLLAEVIGGTRAGESMVVIDTIGAGIGDQGDRSLRIFCQTDAGKRRNSG